MSGDSEPVADESSADDFAGRDDLADEAEAADEADLLDGDDTRDDDEASDAPDRQGARFSWGRVLIAALPVLALLLALGVGYLKWLDGTARESRAAAEESMRAASDSTIAILSYKPETVDQDLKAAADRLAEPFRQQYTQLVTDVVAPGAKQQHISAVATVPAAASVWATGKQAVVLVFVDQTTTIGTDAPTQSTSSVRVSLNKVDGRWLITQFDPV
ncbi:MAG: Mce-associated rane protein [Mycobacterium sp.]|nr:Mce-associated rane protein [Mycobacterium sp.]MDT5226932.1 Mce-associated rane protein [Mycobacterium sp.]